MKLTEYLIPTLKENPKDAEAKSHVVMLRSGMIRKLSSGYYSYLPLGLRVLQKIENVVREEMNRAGAHEVLMPALHPAELWKKTGRYDLMEEILLKVQKGEKEYVLGPTHEEIITELATAYIKSYKDLPKNLYQIQTKFRHEARPRFGVIRSREFIMKDAYSFHTDQESLDETYQKMYAAYQNIFTRCGLSFVVVSADTGAMGGTGSDEFMVPISFGEDHIVLCKECDYAASVEVASCPEPKVEPSEFPEEKIKEVKTPGFKTIEEVAKFLKVNPKRCAKTLLYRAGDDYIACILPGNYDVCEPKLAKFLGASKLELISEEEAKKLKTVIGYAGPVKLNKKIRLIADFSLKGIGPNFVSGANKEDYHYTNTNLKDFGEPEWADVRKIQDGDPCPSCKTPIKLQTSLEIGHVFKLGTKYTNAYEATYLDKDGKEKEILMGCYGIGVNRILASAIEQHHGDKGMVWPLSIAPFQVSLVTANQTSEAVQKAANKIYEELTSKGVEVLYDDRDDRMGAKLNDAELVGAPVLIIVGDRGIKEGKVEFRNRIEGSEENIALDKVVSQVVGVVS